MVMILLSRIEKKHNPGHNGILFRCAFAFLVDKSLSSE